MDLEGGPSTSLVKCCDCECSCNSSMNRSLSGTWLRSVKRKLHEVEEGEKFSIPDFGLTQVARVDISNERDALHEMVMRQQEMIQDLSLELEEERNASSSATNEAMSMILRLQREKAEIQMEARQFKRFAEEKMAHDQQELLALEDLLYKREESIQALYCEVQTYKDRMMSYGLSEAEVESEKGNIAGNNSAVDVDGGFELPVFEYPRLKCNLNENQEQLEGGYDMCEDVEKYAFGETPRSNNHLKDLEFRINQLEKSPRPIKLDGGFASPKNVPEKVIVSAHSPQHVRRVLNGSANGRDMGLDSPKFNGSFVKEELLQVVNCSNLRSIDTVSEADDDTSVRVCTIDSIHQGTYESKVDSEACEDYLTASRESVGQVDLGDPEVKKLYTRLQALEADRESMKQAIISMRTDKAQLVLLKEIAQQLCKDMTPVKRMHLKKSSLFASFSSLSLFKWIWAFIFLRNKARRPKYMFGTSLQNAGLLMLLDKGPCVGQWRCLSRIQMYK